MDWSNEDYVKVYTRETDDDLMLSWQALALWRAMLLKFDRAGLLETRRGIRGLAALVRMPADVVESALAELLEDRRLESVPAGYFAPNFLTAQEASKSDRQRQRESRERRAANARVTIRDQMSQVVTSGHESSQPVTLTSADPLLPVLPDPGDPAPRAHAIPPDGAPATAYDPADPPARGRLSEATYRRVSDARVKIAAELKLPAPIPFPAITPGSETRGFSELRARIREEGAQAPLVCDRVVANLIAQAREERSIDWLAEQVFGDKAWSRAKDWMPGAAARRRGPARGDPLPPAPPPKRPDPPPPDRPLSPEDRAEILALAARVGANPEAAAAELDGGLSSLPTADLVKRFGHASRAPPAPPDAIADEPRKPPARREAAT